MPEARRPSDPGVARNPQPGGFLGTRPIAVPRNDTSPADVGLAMLASTLLP